MKFGTFIIAAILAACLVSPTRAQAERTVIVPFEHKDNAALVSELTQLVVVSAQEAKLTPEVAQASTEDILALTGCVERKDSCFVRARRMMESPAIIFGALTSANEGHSLALSYLRTTGTTHTTIEFKSLASKQSSQRVREQLTALFGGQAPPPPTAKPQSSSPSTTDDRRQVPGYVWGLSIGGASAALAGVTLWTIANTRQDDVNSAPTVTSEDFRKLKSLEDSGRRLTTWGNVLVIGGGAAMVTGGVLFYRAQRHKKSSVALIPVVSGSFVGVTAGGVL